jgi:Lar family restriction alleviation protein
MSDQLKPCPFCGSPAKVIGERVSVAPGLWQTEYFVECTLRECGLRTRTWYPESAAVNSWNRRVVATAVPAQPLMDEFEKLLISYGNAHFDCGEFEDTLHDRKGYHKLVRKANAARDRLLAWVREHVATGETKARVERDRDLLLNACVMAYRKHHLTDDTIGWEELGDILRDALCDVIGDAKFQERFSEQPDTKPQEGA